MTAATLTRKGATSRSRLQSPTADTMIGVLAEKNPKAQKRELESAGRATAALTRLALNLSARQRDRLAANEGLQARLLNVMTAALEQSDAETGDIDVTKQTLAGEGLGSPLSPSEGQHRLEIVMSPMKIEQWAGPVAGSTTLQSDLGIPRSTLQTWRRQGVVVALLKGVKKEVFPLAQFVDGRPVEGLAEVLARIGSPRATWLWLITPHPELGDVAPIAKLQAGAVAEVAELADEDYGQP